MKSCDALSDDSSEFHTAPSTPIDERSCPILESPAKIDPQVSATQTPADHPAGDNLSRSAAIESNFRGDYSCLFWLGGNFFTAEPEQIESESEPETLFDSDSEECAELNRRQRIAYLNAQSAAGTAYGPYHPNGIRGLRERIEHHGRWSPQLPPHLHRNGYSSDSGDENGSDSDDSGSGIIVCGDSHNPGAWGEVGDGLGNGRGRVGELWDGLGLDAPGLEPVERLGIRGQPGVRGGRARDGSGDAVYRGELPGADGRQAEARLGQGGAAAPSHGRGHERPRQGYSPMRWTDVHGTPAGYERQPTPGPSRQPYHPDDCDISRPIVVAPTPRDLVPSYHLTDGGASRAWERDQQQYSQSDVNLMYGLGLFPPTPPTRYPPAETEAPAPPRPRRHRVHRILNAVRRHVRRLDPHPPPTSFSASIDAHSRDILPAGAELQYKQDILTRTMKRVTLDAYRPHDTSPQTVQHVEKEYWDKVARGEMGITRPECVRNRADMAEFAHYLNRVENRIDMYVERGRYDPPPGGSRYEPPFEGRRDPPLARTRAPPRAPVQHPAFMPRHLRAQQVGTDSEDSDLEASCYARH